MTTFVLAYVALGIVIGAVLVGWAAMSSIRRHGLGGAVKAATRDSLDDPPLLGAFAWLCVVAYPVLFVIALASDGFDPVGGVTVLLLWLGGLALLRWHLRTRTRRRAREPDAG